MPLLPSLQEPEGGTAGPPVGWAAGAGKFTMLACTCGATARIADGTGVKRATVGRGGIEYGGGPPVEWGATMGVEESSSVGDKG